MKIFEVKIMSKNFKIKFWIFIMLHFTYTNLISFYNVTRYNMPARSKDLLITARTLHRVFVGRNIENNMII